MTRRPYGTGTLYQKAGSWYGRWLVGDRRANRRLGPVRQPGSREGLTRPQAERELRRRMEQEHAIAATAARLTVREAGDRYLHHVEHVLERKPSTVGDYRIMLDRHMGPFFGDRALERIDPDRIVAYMAAKRRAGLATKTVINHLNFAHGLFAFAVKRGWVATNPVAAVDRPWQPGPNPDIRFLELEDVEAVLRAVPDDLLGPTERVLYLTAAMTGLRQGELIALRWVDVDWPASRLRVRHNRVRGRDGTPKSRRASRAVPLADRVAMELERHFQRSTFQHDHDLVFAHPATGGPLDPSKLLRRFKDALDAAGVRRVRFHDLRHTFGTRMAAVGVPLRTLQEWLGHRDYKTTLIYADYAPNAHEAAWAEKAFAPSGTVSGTELSETESNSEQPKPLK
jgi:integrase